jgi:hypothetical protein
VDVALGGENLGGERFGEPVEFGAQDPVFDEWGDVAADKGEKFAQGGGRFAMRDIQRLGGDDREHGETGVQAAAGALLLAPG